MRENKTSLTKQSQKQETKRQRFLNAVPAAALRLTAAEGVRRLRPQKLVHVLLGGNVH